MPKYDNLPTIHHIHIKPWIGSWLEHVITDAMALANVTGIKVHFIFNEKEFEVEPNVTLEKIMELYY